MKFHLKNVPQVFVTACLLFSYIEAAAIDAVASKKSESKARSSIIFDDSGNAIFTADNLIIGSAINFKPAGNIRAIFPTQILVDGKPDGRMGPPDPREPKPPKVPNYNEPQPKPPKTDPCRNGPGCPIRFRNDEQLIKYGPEVRGINLYKLEKGSLNQEVMGVVGQ